MDLRFLRRLLRWSCEGGWFLGGRQGVVVLAGAGGVSEEGGRIHSL